MTQTWTEIMGFDPYELPLSISAGEAAARWLRHRYSQNTAKLVARDTGMDPRTVENILDGHLSGPTFTKLLLAYRLNFGLTVISAVLGESIQQAAQREIEEIADERRHAEETERHLRAAYAGLHALATVDSGGLRLVRQEDGGSAVQDGGSRGDVGAPQARSSARRLSKSLARRP